MLSQPLGRELIQLPTTEEKVRKFSQSIGTIDGSHSKIAELNKHHSHYINRKGCLSLNVLAVSD